MAKLEKINPSPVVKFMPLIIIGAVIAYASVAYLLLFMPKISNFLEGGEYDLKPLESRLQEEAGYLNEVERALEEFKLVNASHKRKLSLILPPNEDVPGLYVQLAEIAAANDFLLNSVDTIISPTKNDDGTKSVQVAAIFSGADFEQFLLLLNDIERLVRLADVQTISFTAGTGNYNVMLDTYFLEDDTGAIRLAAPTPEADTGE